MSQAMPDPVRRLLSGMPILKPVIPDPGVPFQLVHEDDVAQAFVAGALGKGDPGPYNLAGNGTITTSSLADELGWYSIPIPELAVDATAELVNLLPAKPPVFSWIESVRKPVLMKTDRAKTKLGWKPEYTSKATLKDLVSAYRAEERF
jgi:nucleoside-diphosphate-sugar epimerase